MTTIQKCKTDRQKWEARLDGLFRELIRRRAWARVGGCERAQYVANHEGVMRWQDLQTAHLHSCRNHTTRWDPRNAVGLCGGCHMYLDSHIDAKAEFARKVLGDEYDRLYILANLTSKQSPIDYKMVELYLKEEIKELEGL